MGVRSSKKSGHSVSRLGHLETHFRRPLSHFWPLAFKSRRVFNKFFQKLTNVLCFSFKNQPKIDFPNGPTAIRSGPIFSISDPPPTRKIRFNYSKITHALHTSGMIDRRQDVFVQLKTTNNVLPTASNQGPIISPNLQVAGQPTNIQLAKPHDLPTVRRSTLIKQPSFSSGERHEFTEAVVKTGLTYN